jgi:hypothetical protein
MSSVAGRLFRGSKFSSPHGSAFAGNSEFRPGVNVQITCKLLILLRFFCAFQRVAPLISAHCPTKKLNDFNVEK